MAAKKGMRFELVDVSPEMARNWLDNANQGNRHLSQRFSSLLARDMSRNVFQLTHEAIAFDENGRLIDGQHRLRAIVDSGKTVRLWIAFDCPADSQKYVDAGRKRSMSDAYGFYFGDGLSKKAEAVTNAMMNPMASEADFTRYDQATFYKAHENAIHFAMDLFKGTKKGVAKAKVIAIVARASYTQDKARLSEFAECMKSGMTFSPGDRAAIDLRDTLLSEDLGSPGAQRWLYKRTEYLLDMYLRRRSRFGRRACADHELFLIPGEKGYAAPQQERSSAAA